MSKKHPFQSHSSGAVSHSILHEAEYRIIKSDLVKVAILNLVYLVGILALYYFNQKTLFLENWFAKVLHF